MFHWMGKVPIDKFIQISDTHLQFISKKLILKLLNELINLYSVICYYLMHIVKHILSFIDVICIFMQTWYFSRITERFYKPVERRDILWNGPVHLSVGPSVGPSVCLPVHPSFLPSVCPSVCSTCEPFNQSASILKYDIRPPKIRTLLILGHLLKPRWPPSNFLNICYRYHLWTRYLQNRFPNQFQISFMMSYQLEDGRYWFWAMS